MTPRSVAVFQVKQILLNVGPAVKAYQAFVMADYPVTVTRRKKCPDSRFQFGDTTGDNAFNGGNAVDMDEGAGMKYPG